MAGECLAGGVGGMVEYALVICGCLNFPSEADFFPCLLRLLSPRALCVAGVGSVYLWKIDV